MQIWRRTPKDAILLAISVLQLAGTVLSALTWNSVPVSARIAEGAALAVAMAYNIIVVSHLFTHVPWFAGPRLNAAASVLNSVDIGQSVQAYQLTHVRNHHRFNNDRQGSDGETRDKSSTYRFGKDGEHQRLAAYAVGGAADSFVHRGRELLAVRRLWRVGANERNLLTLASMGEGKRRRELRQIQLDRTAHCLFLILAAVYRPQWLALCYLPAFFVALTLVNVQNYYRHFGANPDSRAADSVSHYGRLYNFLTFNDGYHQEHHLAPGTHWSMMPQVRSRHRENLDAQPRIISPVPAMLGFLDRRRPLLHHESELERVS